MGLEGKQIAGRIDAAAAGARGDIDSAREGVADMQALRREIDQGHGALRAEVNALQRKNAEAFTESGAWDLRPAPAPSSAGDINAAGFGAGASNSDQQPAGSSSDAQHFDATGNETGAAQ